MLWCIFINVCINFEYDGIVIMLKRHNEFRRGRLCTFRFTKPVTLKAVSNCVETTKHINECEEITASIHRDYGGTVDLRLLDDTILLKVSCSYFLTKGWS